MEKTGTITDKDREYMYRVLYSARKTMAVEIRDGELLVRAPKGLEDEQIENFLRAHIRWIRNRMEQNTQILPDAFTPKERQRLMHQAGEILREKAAYYARLMGVRYQHIYIKEQKTVWGSCSSRGNLNFNWKLIFTGPDQLEYVVVHELAHLKQMNHSSAFWKEVEKVLPDYRERRKRLKSYRP